MNATTIEFKEKLRGDSNITKTYFNLGLFKNIKEILGSNSLLWFIPISKKLFILRIRLRVFWLLF
jgi:hypothetical protein